MGPVRVEHVLRAVSAPVTWTAADALIWHEFRKSATWAKLEAVSRDSMLQDILPETPVMVGGLNPELTKAYVLGRQMQMEYLGKLAFRPVPDDPKSGEETEMPGDERDDSLSV